MARKWCNKNLENTKTNGKISYNEVVKRLEENKMSNKLIANFIFVGIEDNIIMIGFADDENNTKEHLLLQKALEFDEQDKALGQDKVHITYNDELFSSYGGILQITLKAKTVEIILDENTAKKLRTEEQIEITLPQSSYDRDNLINHLKLMFKDEPDVLSIEM